MGLFRRRDSGSHPVQAPPAPTQPDDRRPGWIRDGLLAALLDGDEALRVAGTSYYQANLWCLAGKKPGGKQVQRTVTALLVTGDGNPHDGNAIAVWIDGLQVGHLAQEDAARYRPGLLALQRAHGVPVALSGLITDGGPRGDGPGQIDVFLRHDPADFSPGTPVTADDRDYAAFGLTAGDLEDARLAYQRNYNHRFMNCGRGSAEIIAVTGTSSFQEALQQAVAAPRPWRHEHDRHLPAVLSRVPGNREAVAVLIDGLVTGYLDQEDADRHREQLDDLERSGQYLVCGALIVGGQNGGSLGIRLRVKPGIGARWAAGAKPPAAG